MTTKIKKHIPTSGYQFFSQLFCPLFEPLSADEEKALDLGAETFRARFPDTLLFPDPFLAGKQGAPPPSLHELCIVYGNAEYHQELGEALAAAIRAKWGYDVAVIAADDPRAALSSSAPRLLLGGSDTNPRAMDIARRYQVGVFSSEYPGEEGWGLTTHWELETGFTPCYLLACDAAMRQVASEAALGQIATSAGRLQWAHQVCPGPGVPEEFQDFDRWISLFKATPHLELFNQWLRGGREHPYRELFREFYSGDFSEDGVPYNAYYMDLGVDAIRYYQCTGSLQALELFREMLWGLWGYFNSDNPRIYISDMDFRIGLICNYWNWVQHHPSIPQEERSTFDRLLLGALRMVRDYFRNLWRDLPGTPHNHQTFKARSLILGWRYFKDFDVPDAPGWKQDADFLFGRVDLKASKHSENASGYETFVPEHTLAWLEATGQAVPGAMKEALALFALRDWAMRDNFLFPLDYGDWDPHLTPGRPFEVGPWLQEDTSGQRTVLALEAASGGCFPFKIAMPYRGFPGLQRAGKGRELPVPAGWELIPLDPAFARQNAAAGASEEQFDKLAWRSGWNPRSLYLALEGIGNQTVSHAHNEANGILRMNLGGRIWLVSNGYGKQAGIRDAGMAFATRQLGPEEHNMLVVRDVESGQGLVPPVNAQLKAYGVEPIPFAVSELAGYGGITWRRHILILPERGVVVADKVTGSENRSVPWELQWNILGSLTPAPFGAVVEQDGMRLVWEQFGTVAPQWEESQISAWRDLIQSGAYRGTQAMPTHCIQKAAADAFGQDGEVFLLNGFWLEGSVGPVSWDRRSRELTLTADGPFSPAMCQSDGMWGKLSVQGADLKVCFA